jgi:signal transduction protein with GAF and PtsI domain
LLKFFRSQAQTPNKEKIFSILNDVSYVLALSRQPRQLIEMVLDKLVQVFDLDCCWAQLIRLEDRRLHLVASRGFTPEMVRELDAEEEHTLSGQAVMGLRVVIADLSRDGNYGLSSFAEAQLRSLVAVPMRTYRTHGVLGIASRSERRFDEEFAELLTVIAGFIGAAINTAQLTQIVLTDNDRRESRAEPDADNGAQDSPVTETVSEPPPAIINTENFERHAQRMSTFYSSHKRI